jgi:hypothetical protein
MCLFYEDFKHRVGSKRKNFHNYRKISSIISAKVLSIMQTNTGRVTFG